MILTHNTTKTNIHFIYTDMKISLTLHPTQQWQINKTTTTKTERLFSCDIEDGKVEIDSATGARTEYKLIDGGYEMIITTKQPNGTVKTQVKTFYDPKPVTEEDLAKQNANKKIIKNKASSLAKLDRNTTMVTREIPGGYEEVYTTVNNDGTKSIRTKTFYDAVQEEITDESTKVQTPKKKTTTTAKTSKDEVDESHRMQKLETNKKTNVMKRIDSEEYNIKHQSTFEETRTHTQKTEISGTNTSIRKNSIQEQSTRAISTSSDTKKDTKKLKRNKSIPPPPPDFIENDSTTVTSKKIRGGVEYTYSTTLESGQTITTTKTVFQEEEIDMTEEEINQYKKVLKDAEKHKNVTGTKKLKSDSGTKKVVPSENPGDVTTVETIKIEGGTEYHYTTVTAEGIVKKATKTIYDPVPVKASPEESDEEEIVEEYEEEVIEPGDKTVRTIEHTKTLPKRFEEEITITKEKKEKKVKKSMMISQ